jgi:broad specificity phosphatase PhoE
MSDPVSTHNPTFSAPGGSQIANTRMVVTKQLRHLNFGPWGGLQSQEKIRRGPYNTQVKQHDYSGKISGRGGS